MVIYIFLLLLSLWYLIKCLPYDLKLWRIPSPGICLPFIGHMHILLRDNKDPVNHMWNLYKKYHKGQHMMWVRKLNVDFVYVGEIGLLKKIFNHPDVQDRDLEGFKASKQIRGWNGDTYNDHPGIALSSGKIWAEQRKFTAKALKELGYGKSRIEDLIKEEVTHFLASIQDMETEKLDFGKLFNIPTVNALWTITTGERIEYSNNTIHTMTENLHTVFSNMTSNNTALIYAHPWLLNVPFVPQLLGWPNFVASVRYLINKMKQEVARHKENIDADDPKDYTDKMLVEIQNTKDSSSTFFGEKGEENLANNLWDLFAGGSDTTSSTLSWAVLFMVKHPEIQENVYKEILRVVGKSRLPTLEERKDMVYTEAVIMEVQRMANITFEGVGHRCKEDVSFNGVVFPKGTLVMGLFSEIHKGNHWEEADKFIPERFIDDVGSLKKLDNFAPFSVGKRQCLGEALAKAELFLFFTGLIQQFRIYNENPEEIDTNKYTFGLNLQPVPTLVRIEARQ